MCPLLFWSFLKVSPVEIERKAVLPRGQTAGPKRGLDGQKWTPLSPGGVHSLARGIWNFFI